MVSRSVDAELAEAREGPRDNPGVPFGPGSDGLSVEGDVYSEGGDGVRGWRWGNGSPPFPGRDWGRVTQVGRGRIGRRRGGWGWGWGSWGRGKGTSPLLERE